MNRKPTKPGAYWVRGFNLSRRKALALVEVAEVKGELRCNLHETNSDHDRSNWRPMSGISDTFEWIGPLVHDPAKLKEACEALDKGTTDEPGLGTSTCFVNYKLLQQMRVELAALAKATPT